MSLSSYQNMAQTSFNDSKICINTIKSDEHMAEHEIDLMFMMHKEIGAINLTALVILECVLWESKNSLILVQL